MVRKRLWFLPSGASSLGLMVTADMQETMKPLPSCSPFSWTVWRKCMCVCVCVCVCVWGWGVSPDLLEALPLTASVRLSQGWASLGILAPLS